MSVFLETDRLILRQFTLDDTDNLFQLDKDPEVVRYVDSTTDVPRETIIQERIPWFLRIYQMSGGDFGYWAAIEKISGEFIGWFQLLPYSPQDRSCAELGYRLKRSAWGKGYATEGAKALVQKGFSQLGCESIFSNAQVANKASIRVMEKAGLHLEEYYIHTSPDGVEKEAVRYAVSKTE